MSRRQRKLDVGFGRLTAPDPRDQRHLMRAVPLRRVPDRSVRRRIGPILHQGDTSTCVGHAWRAWMNAGPTMTKPHVGPTPFEIYDGCVPVDEWPENDHDAKREFGTSVRAGAKMLQAEGRIRRYLWASDAETVASFLIDEGTVVLGTDWYESFMEPADSGRIEIGGSVIGGHAYLVYGYDHDDREFLAQNSWGVQWGDRGRFRIPWRVLATLLRDNGEACGAIERAV